MNKKMILAIGILALLFIPFSVIWTGPRYAEEGLSEQENFERYGITKEDSLNACKKRLLDMDAYDHLYDCGHERANGDTFRYSLVKGSDLDKSYEFPIYMDRLVQYSRDTGYCPQGSKLERWGLGACNNVETIIDDVESGAQLSFMDKLKLLFTW
jgi:hypothetical protein